MSPWLTFIRTVDVESCIASLRDMHDKARQFDDRRASERTLIMLLSLEGSAAKQVAVTAGCCERTVHAVRKRYMELGLDGLSYVNNGGRPSRIGDEQIAFLRSLVSHNSPRQLGLPADTWSPYRLSQLVRREFGIECNRPQMRRLLPKLTGD